MSEYKVDYIVVSAKSRDIDIERIDNETYSGVFIHIQPPLQLNPDAVERYLKYCDFEPINRNDSQEMLDIKDVVVLGSTLEQTTIYASIDKRNEGRLAERAAEYTVELLRFMGAQAIIDHPSSPEA